MRWLVIISGQKMEPAIRDLDMSNIPCIGVDRAERHEVRFVMSDNFQIASRWWSTSICSAKELQVIGSTADSRSLTSGRPVREGD
jgi:LacI family transcriptional regulator